MDPLDDKSLIFPDLLDDSDSLLLIMSPKMKFNIVIKPNNHPELDLTFYLQPRYAGSSYNGASFGYEAKKTGETMMKYDGVHKREIDGSKHSGSLNTELQLNDKSMMYGTFCKIGNAVGSGCFKSRKMELSVFFDKVNKNKLFNKFSFAWKNIKDGETRLEVSGSTLQNPYQLKIISPRLVKAIGSNEFTVTADHKPGKEITIDISFQKIKLFFKHGPVAGGRNYFAQISKAGESFLTYNMDLNFKKDAAAINMGVKSQFDVNEKSLLYSVFCSYGSGCFKQRKADISVFIDLINMNALINKFDIIANLLKDDEV